MLLVPYSKQACCWLPNARMQVNCLSSEGTTLRQEEHHDATAKITSMLHIRSFLPFENHPPSFSLPRLDESCLLPSIYSIIDPIIDAKASFLAKVN
jgi:hypothetical protein